MIGLNAGQNSLGGSMITLRVRATGSGRIVNWPKFKKGKMVACSRWSCLLTTVLTDVVTDLLDEANRMDPNSIVTPLFPNGFTTASFDIAIKGKDFQVNCGRRLVRGLFPLNPIAAEFGSNYDVLVTIAGDTGMLEQRIAEGLREKYRCQSEMSIEQ
jgi:hypothetical protein